MSDFKGRHFRGEIVLWAVRWYCRYPISYRDLEAMMTERGVAVDHSTIYRWVQRFAPEMEKRLRELPLFEAPAVEALFQGARGLPRQMAHYALSAAALDKARTVNADHLQNALDELRP